MSTLTVAPVFSVNFGASAASTARELVVLRGDVERHAVERLVGREGGSDTAPEKQPADRTPAIAVPFTKAEIEPIASLRL